MSPAIDKSSSNTECTVIVHTHDRGHKAPSQEIDLSPYLTAVTVSQHLESGGSASISLPAVDHIENIVAAGDVVNIYFNTHRDDVNAYNKGNVRVFFGYVTSVAKSVSVGGMGEKLTTYSIDCRDFSKAIRNTNIYNNEHLQSQSRGGKTGVIRADLGSNLGGIALLSRGIAMMGSPRQIILQNLMRFLGFGGQWALPHNYMERLPGSSHTFVKSTKETPSDFITSLGAVARQVRLGNDPKVQESLVKALVGLSKVVANGQWLAMKTSSVSQVWDDVVSSSVRIVDQDLHSLVKSLTSKYKILRYDLEPTKGRGTPAPINNTFFKVSGKFEDGVGSPFSLGSGYRSVGKHEQGLMEDLSKVVAKVFNEIESTNPGAIKEGPGAFPKANLYAQNFDSTRNNTPVRTIFNILCLDYMEDVSGYWSKESVINHQGSLMATLQTGANTSMNEFFFDLRPSPEFRSKSVDGLGVRLDGAIPMVPAVVLRRKPFTNYQLPNSEISNSDVDGHLVIGGYKVGGKFHDQLVLNSGGALGTSNAVALEKGDLASITSSLKKATGTNAISAPKVLEKDIIPTDKGKKSTGPIMGLGGETQTLEAWKDKIVELGKSFNSDDNPNSQIISMLSATKEVTGSSKKTASYIAATVAGAQVDIAKRSIGGYVTLPRPIFRSPDKNRITKEVDLGQSQYVLGYMHKDTEEGSTKTTFYAFLTKKDTGDGVPTKNIDYKLGFEKGFGEQDSLLMAGSSAKDINANIGKSSAAVDKKTDLTETESKNIDWHVLDYMTIDPTEVMSENYSRGDFDVINFLEYWGSTMGSIEAQRLHLGTIMPFISPTSVYRFGVRSFLGTTEHVQAMLSGSTDSLSDKNILIRWAVLQDMWNQHNHEYLFGTMNLRGMPGIRPGYRLDRLDLNLSFYVESVSHSWGHPGNLTTQVSVSRGQPYGVNNALRYERPTPNKAAYESERQSLGKVFSTSEFKKEGSILTTNVNLESPGTYTGPDGVGKQIKRKTRPKDPNKKEGP